MSLAPTLLHLASPPPLLTHQVAGHRTDGGGFRSHSRRRSSGSAHAHHHPHASTEATMSAADNDDASHHATVLKPMPSHKAASAREQKFYEQLEELRAQLKEEEAAERMEACVASKPHLQSLCRCSAALSASDGSHASNSANLRSWLSFFPRYFGAVHMPAHSTLAATAASTATTLSLATDSSASSFASSSAAASVSSSVSATAPLTYLHLEDATHGMSHPSLIDVKMGLQSSDPFEASRDKIEREAAKCPSQATSGFRVCGARVCRGTSAQNGDDKGAAAFHCYDKHWGRAIRTDQLELPFWIFLGHRDSNSAPTDETTPSLTPSPAVLRTASLVLPLLLSRLRTLLQLCTHAPRWRLYASSILLSYQLEEEKPRSPSSSDSDGQSVAPFSPPLRVDARVHLIDFGHAYPIDQPLPPHAVVAQASANSHSEQSPASCICFAPTLVDTNYLAGLHLLIRIFESMLAQATRSQNQK